MPDTSIYACEKCGIIVSEKCVVYSGDEYWLDCPVCKDRKITYTRYDV